MGRRTRLHSGGFSSFDDGHGLTGVYPVLADRVTVQVSDWLHWNTGKHLCETICRRPPRPGSGLWPPRGLTLVGFAVELHLVGLHHFLDGLSDVAQAHVDTGVLRETEGLFFKDCAAAIIEKKQRDNMSPPLAVVLVFRCWWRLSRPPAACHTLD